jgi:hypothetical protein
MRRSVLATVASAATALALLAAPAPADPAPGGGSPAGAAARGAGAWTRITTGTVPNIVEPGMLRTADGVLHVVYLRQGTSASDLAFANLSPQGKLVATGNAVAGWASLPEDPKLVPTPDGGIRLVFGGLQDTNVANPYSSGQMFSATAPAAGTAWSVQPGALTQSGYAYASYGTGATTLADGSPVVAFPLNSTLTWNAGGAPTDATSAFAECCLYYVSLARTGEQVWSAFYANGSAEGNQGVFVKQLLPAEGAAVKAPGSTTGGDSVSASQAVPLIALPDGGLLTAYCVGYPTCRSIGLWRVGAPKPFAVPGSRDAREYAVALEPNGRAWVAWSTGSGQVRFARSASYGVGFGAVTTIRPPAGATVYSMAVSAADGSADLVLGDGSSLWHRQVLPGLSLKATPQRWRKSKDQHVTFTVTDAGAKIKGAHVSGGGESCATGADGRCTLSYPAGRARHIWVVASHKGYGDARVRLSRR